MKTILTVTFILSISFSITSFSQSKCPVTLKISGERADGNGTWEKEFDVHNVCSDFDETKRNALNDFHNKNYGPDYKMVEPATDKYDCAGLTLHRLFGVGPYFVQSKIFKDAIIPFFGKKIQTSITWQDVQPGDVLVYGTEKNINNHIAYIESVETLAGVVTGVVIKTKNGVEPVYTRRFGFTIPSTDALATNFGSFDVYRIDVSKVKVSVVDNCDCTFTGTWKSSWGIMKLVQTGETVTGDYDFRNGKIQNGKVYTNKDGFLEFRATWTQDNTDPPTGEVIMTLKNDGNIDGKYSFKSSNDWHEDWDHVRVK